MSCAFSTLRNSTSRPTGTIMAPPSPCSTRAAVSAITSPLSPQRTEPRGEHRDGGTEDGATAEPIRRPTPERNEHREAQEIGGNGHAEPHRIGMQRYRHLRQRRGDDGGVDLLHDDRRCDDDGDEFWFRLGGRGRDGDGVPLKTY